MNRSRYMMDPKIRDMIWFLEFMRKKKKDNKKIDREAEEEKRI